MSPSGYPLCLLLVVTAACLWLSCEGSAYQGFLDRHMDYPRTTFGGNRRDYCDRMMRRKHMRCQKRNTFIHADADQLKSICSSQGQMLAGSVTSNTPFPITVCKITGLFKRLCRYKGKSKMRKIKVTCDKGWPVHYITYV